METGWKGLEYEAEGVLFQGSCPVLAGDTSSPSRSLADDYMRESGGGGLTVSKNTGMRKCRIRNDV